MIQTLELTPAAANFLLEAKEGQFFEFKSVSISPADLTKTISAFANSDGGGILIGIEDGTPPVWAGFMDEELANGHLQIFDKLFPLGTDFSYTFFKCATKSGVVLSVHVNKTRAIFKASNGIPYIRRGAQNLPQTSIEAIQRLERAKGISTYENETLNTPIETITKSSTVKNFMQVIVPHTTAEPWLKKQLLISGEKPTVAGTVLFADEPQIYLPKRCGIKISRYKTREAEGFREALAFLPETIEGPLIDQIRNAVERTIRIIESTPVLTDDALKKIEYPSKALHEIITNALIHRDYSLADDVHVRIFDNRVEVQSPGKLPAHITVGNILDERFARNGTIVRILNKFPNPPNQDIGEGLNTAFKSLTDSGLKTPVISERGNSVLVIVKHELRASPVETIMDYLAVHGSIANREARRITHIPADYTVKRLFVQMMKANLIEPVPTAKSANMRYQKKSADGNKHKRP